MTDLDDTERRKLPDAAVLGLKQRYVLRQAAERDLTTFLDGVAAALDIPRERVLGFDDDAGELILAAE